MAIDKVEFAFSSGGDNPSPLAQVGAVGDLSGAPSAGAADIAAQEQVGSASANAANPAAAGDNAAPAAANSVDALAQQRAAQLALNKTAGDDFEALVDEYAEDTLDDAAQQVYIRP